MAWLIIPRSVSIVPNRSSSSVPTQRLGIDRTTSWSHVRSVVGKAEPVRGLIRPPGAVMGQHPRTWFSSTTAGFPRADAAWLLRQISSLETPAEVPIAPETRLERLERLTKLGQRALVERCDQMSGPPEPT